MAIAYLFPLSFPASLARERREYPVLNRGIIASATVIPGLNEKAPMNGMIRTAFLEEVKQVKRMDPLLHARCRALCALSYIKLHYSVLRSSTPYRPVNCIRLLWCTHPVHVIEKRPSRMMIDIFGSVDMRLSG